MWQKSKGDIKGLTRLQNGKIRSTPLNILKILESDEELVGKLSIDENGDRIITGNLPWRQYNENDRFFRNGDVSCLHWYLETKYGVYRGTVKALHYLFAQIHFKQ